MRKAFDPAKHCGVPRRSDDENGVGHKGEPCRNFKGTRTKHVGVGPCWLHLGNAPHMKGVVARERVALELLKLGVQVEIDPQAALLQMVWEAAGNVAYLRGRVQQLEAIFGPNHLGDAEPHVLVEMYAGERERLAKFSKIAIDAGIAQRQLDLIERLADPIVIVVMAALEGLPEAEQERRRRIAVAKLGDFADYDILAATPAQAAR